MRILLASDFFPPSPGGLEAHVQRLANALIRREHEVVIVTCTARPDPLPGSAAIVSAMTMLGRAPQLFREGGRPYPPPFPDASFRRAVSRLADRWQPDVIHAHGWCAFSCYWPSAPPLVVTLHDHGLRCPKKTLIRENAECVSGRGIRCVTCAGAQPITKRLPLTAVMTHSVPRLVASLLRRWRSCQTSSTSTTRLATLLPMPRQCSLSAPTASTRDAQSLLMHSVACPQARRA
jgi:glycosyltransferase involved in cell wall biosynthesis